MGTRRSCEECLVRGSDCFCNLDTEALRTLNGLGTEVRYAERALLLEEGSTPERVCVICRGMVKLTTSSAKGGLLLLRLAGPGDVLGLASVVKGTAYDATAEALEECEVRVIPRRELIDFMNTFRESELELDEDDGARVWLGGVEREAAGAVGVGDRKAGTCAAGLGTDECKARPRGR